MRQVRLFLDANVLFIAAHSPEGRSAASPPFLRATPWLTCSRPNPSDRLSLWRGLPGCASYQPRCRQDACATTRGVVPTDSASKVNPRLSGCLRASSTTGFSNSAPCNLQVELADRHGWVRGRTFLGRSRLLRSSLAFLRRGAPNLEAPAASPGGDVAPARERADLDRPASEGVGIANRAEVVERAELGEQLVVRQGVERRLREVPIGSLFTPSQRPFSDEKSRRDGSRRDSHSAGTNPHCFGYRRRRQRGRGARGGRADGGDCRRPSLRGEDRSLAPTTSPVAPGENPGLGSLPNRIGIFNRPSSLGGSSSRGRWSPGAPAGRGRRR